MDLRVPESPNDSRPRDGIGADVGLDPAKAARQAGSRLAVHARIGKHTAACADTCVAPCINADANNLLPGGTVDRKSVEPSAVHVLPPCAFTSIAE